MKTPLDSLAPFAAFLARHSAIVALAVFAVVGIAVLDDYGMTLDDEAQWLIGRSSFDYILGDEGALIEEHSNRHYSVAFEVPLAAVERLLRLADVEDSRAVYLSRRLVAHLFFLAGGFFAWLLAYRLFESRLMASLAMLIFLLHPRIYAHSFINTKDLPFLSAYMVALYLTHRAFRRDAVWAFALCGAGVGLLTNFRVMGLTLFPAVLGMLALDALCAMKRDGRYGAKQALANAGAFLAAFAATLYAARPLLWRDPLNLIETLETLSRHPVHVPTLFRGDWVRWPNLPWDFIPTWILITTPPVALILAALGTAYLARRCAADWRGALANSTARFGLLALACLTLPVAGVIALNSNLYNDWRQMYFLYAPICVLAAFGLRGLIALPKPSLRAAAFALAALGIAAAAVQTVRLHPYQNDYFNALVNKDSLSGRWGMDYWHVSHREALETLLEIQPTGTIALTDPMHDHVKRSAMILPKDDRRRFAISLKYPSFHIVSGHPPGALDALAAAGESVIWKREVYGVPIVWIVDERAESQAALSEAYAAARQSPPAASGGGFDIYRTDDSLIYIKETCGAEDAGGTFQISITPSHREDAPERGYESASFGFWRYGAAFGGKCLISVSLPDYPVHAIETKTLADDGGAAWETVIPLGESLREYAAALSAPPGEYAASGGGFDMHADGDTLIYINEGCDEEVARGRFFLSVFPADRNDLPQTARDAGREHESLNFVFYRYGAMMDGKCVIIRDLPDYSIGNIETGQWVPGEGELWRAEIAFGD